MVQLAHYLRGILAKLELAAVTNRKKRLILTIHWYWTCDIPKKICIKNCPSTRWEVSIVKPPSSLRPPGMRVREWGSRMCPYVKIASPFSQAGSKKKHHISRGSYIAGQSNPNGIQKKYADNKCQDKKKYADNKCQDNTTNRIRERGSRAATRLSGATSIILTPEWRSGSDIV